MGVQSNNPTSRGGRSDAFRGGRPNERPVAQPIAALPIPDDYLDKAEELMRQNARLVTTSKIRRLFSLVTEIYNEENLSKEDTLAESSKAAIGMARIRFAYECGRDRNVKDFVEKALLMNYLKGIGDSRQNFIKFAQYMEALVAYHKFFGGREN